MAPPTRRLASTRSNRLFLKSFFCTDRPRAELRSSALVSSRAENSQRAVEVSLFPLNVGEDFPSCRNARTGSLHFCALRIRTTLFSAARIVAARICPLIWKGFQPCLYRALMRRSPPPDISPPFSWKVPVFFRVVALARRPAFAPSRFWVVEPCALGFFFPPRLALRFPGLVWTRSLWGLGLLSLLRIARLFPI